MKRYLIIVALVFLWSCGSSKESVNNDSSKTGNTVSLIDSNSVENSGYTYRYVIQLAVFEKEVEAKNFVNENQPLVNYELTNKFNELTKHYLIQLPVFNSRLKAENVLAELKQLDQFTDVVMIIKKVNVNY